MWHPASRGSEAPRSHTPRKGRLASFVHYQDTDTHSQLSGSLGQLVSQEQGCVEGTASASSVLGLCSLLNVCHSLSLSSEDHDLFFNSDIQVHFQLEGISKPVKTSLTYSAFSSRRLALSSKPGTLTLCTLADSPHMVGDDAKTSFLPHRSASLQNTKGLTLNRPEGDGSPHPEQNLDSIPW